MFDCSLLQPYLKGQQKGKEKFMLLIKATAGIAENRKCQVVNDAVDTFACDRRFLRSVNIGR